MKRIVTRTLIAVCALFVLAAPLSAADPSAACVRVGWKKWGGSGTCVDCEHGRSLVISANHIFSERYAPDGGFARADYPLPAYAATRDGKTYPAIAIAGLSSLEGDLALLVVDAALPVCELADEGEMPAPGETVWHRGVGTGGGVGKTLPLLNSVRPCDRFLSTMRTESGDSGAAVIYKGKLVAVHCGKDPAGRARGTPATPVRDFLRKAREKLADARPMPRKPEPKKDEPKKPAPQQAAPPVILHYHPAPSCAGGSCQPTRRGLFRRW